MKIPQTVYFAHHCGQQCVGLDTQFSSFSYDPSQFDSEWVLVGQAVVDVEVDMTAMTAAHVEALQSKIQKVNADAQVKVTQLQAAISNLLAISYAPADVADSESSNDIPF
jgi:hypothetical protein